MRIVVLGLVQALALLLVSAVLDGLTISGFGSALGMVTVLALLNALVWPFVIRVTLPLLLWTVGLFTFVLNALFVSAAAAAFEGVDMSSFWIALGVAMVLTVVNIVVGGMLHVDGDHVWRSKVARRVLKRRVHHERTDVPGFLFIQIDGLAEPVLRQALDLQRLLPSRRLGGLQRLYQRHANRFGQGVVT